MIPSSRGRGKYVNLDKVFLYFLMVLFHGTPPPRPKYLLLRGTIHANELPPGCKASLNNKQLLINEEIFSAFVMFFPFKVFTPTNAFSGWL